MSFLKGIAQAFPREINFKKPMLPPLDRQQRQRNMNPGSGQSKQESYVIMLTEIGFTRV